MNWRPASEKHAIERVAFTALLGFPLPPKPFDRLLTKVRRKAGDTGINEMIVLPKPLQITLGAQDPKLSGPQLAPKLEFGATGQAFRKTENGRVLEEIVFSNGVLAFAATSYNHWSEFSERVRECLSEIIDTISDITNITEIRIEYWDRFDLVDGDTKARSEFLINPSSTLLAHFYQRINTSWHTHLGFFLDEGSDVRTLVNANIDVIANAPGLPPVLADGYLAQARFYTLISAQNTLPDKGFENWETIKNRIDSGHELSKSIVGDLIHPALAEKIDLKAKPFRTNHYAVSRN